MSNNTKNKKIDCEQNLEDLIKCNEDKKFIEMMIKGYKEMGKLNLQLAIDNEGELGELEEYEAWLCGV